VAATFAYGPGVVSTPADYTTEGRKSRPKADSGVGSWGGGSKPPPQLEGLGSAVSSPSGVWGGAPIAQRFSTIFSTQDGLS